MADTGWKYSTNYWSKSGWSLYTIARLQTADGLPCQASYPTAGIAQLKTFNFGIPSGQKIDGIEVQCKVWTDTNAQVQAWLSGDAGATWSNTYWTVFSAGGGIIFPTWGSPTDNWGRVWTPSEFDTAKFSLLLMLNCGGGLSAYIDYLWVKVYYSPAAVVLAGTIPGSSSLAGNLAVAEWEELAGSIDAVSALSGTLEELLREGLKGNIQARSQLKGLLTPKFSLTQKSSHADETKNNLIEYFK